MLIFFFFSGFCHEDLQSLFLLAENNINFGIIFDSHKNNMHVFFEQFTFETFCKPFFLNHRPDHDKCHCCSSIIYYPMTFYDVLFKKSILNNTKSLVFVSLLRFPESFIFFCKDFNLPYQSLLGFVFKKEKLYQFNPVFSATQFCQPLKKSFIYRK